jgi:hypothetical protein
MISAELQGIRNVRTVIGLMLAPIIGFFVMALVGVFPEAIDELSARAEPILGQVLSFLSMTLMFGMIISFPVGFLLLWPAHMLLSRLHWINVIAYIALGAGLGAVLSFGFVELLYGTIPGGAVGGLVFWLIRRPDKDSALTRSPSPPT